MSAVASADSSLSSAALLVKATAAHEAGRLEEAKTLYVSALASNPHSPEAEHGLGWLHVQQGDWSAAMPRFAKALKLRPWEQEFWISQIEALFHVGHFEAVHRLLHRAAESGLPQPTIRGFEARLNDRRLTLLTERVKASGRSAKQASEAPMSELMAMREDFLKRRFPEARAKALKLVHRYPLCAFAWRVLGASQPASLSGDQRLEELRIACDLDPRGIDATMNLALVLHELGRLDEAAAIYASVLEQQPDNVRALVNCGLLLNARHDAKAEEMLRRARTLGSTDHRVALALGAYLRDQDRLAEAAPLLEEAFAADEKNASCLSALSVCYLGLGRHEEAAALFRRLDTSKSAHLGALSIALFVGAHIAEVSAEELFRLHCRYGELVEEASTPHVFWENDRNPVRKLRVGFVSGDFRRHAMASFVAPLWEGLDRDAFEVYAYSNHRLIDETTAQLRALAHGWCDITGMSDELAAERVRKDRIDVLVDLSGHTGFSRLGVFALKPAPVQVSTYGYPATTGLRRMDYYMADTTFAPPGLVDDQFTEKLMLGAANASFQAPEGAPDPAPLPSAQGAPFTFGSFNRMSKITPRTVQLWAAVLRASPAARMMVGAADSPSEARLRAHFVAEGVDSARVLFLQRMDMTSYLEAHAQIDLLLDTSPYAGGTTTCYGLWMGVPTLTVPGATLPSRAGAAILDRVGLKRFVADGPDDFVARAAALADPASSSELAGLRGGMRERVQASTIGSPRAAIESFEDGVRMAWRRWCDGLLPEQLIVPPRVH